MTNKIIAMSIFDLLKTGPGPSSSHTIGPMRAGFNFSVRVKALNREILNRAKGIKIRLYGSLSATGRGHGTDRAVIAGLMGNEPATCPPTLLSDFLNIPKERKIIDLGIKKLPVDLENIEYSSISHNFPYNNTLIIDLLSEQDLSRDASKDLHNNALFSMEYYSIGGGFLQWKGWIEQDNVIPPHPYSNMTELKKQLKDKNLSLERLLLQNEMAISGLTEEEIKVKLDKIIYIMKDTVNRGINTEGVLPGPIGLKKKSKEIKRTSRFFADY
ncbi:MAG: hypothetical protein LBS29_02500 [Endomicrobium sp.]|jgi:L-serine dehydratase|nr:hypothetical protein [Endomicrobium sp.]